MSQQDLEKWNKRYAENSERKGNPVSLISDWLEQIPRGAALDVACGAGRNSILLAQYGFAVDAIDISAAGLQRARQAAIAANLQINWIQHDLDEPYPFRQNYALIIVMWYVNPDLISQLCSCLATGGYLICQEHLISAEDVIGPDSNRFRVAPGALRNALTDLEILFYAESVETIEEGTKVASARVVARKL